VSSAEVTRHIPLKPNWFHILLTLSDGQRHGYAIMKEVAERTDGKVRLWPATLYGSIRRLEEEGLVEPVASDDDAESDDERRVNYALTSVGRSVLAAEVRRLEELVRLAHAKGAAFQ
jgi:DNA-binding PadR family transcriptional regulator